MIIKCQFVLILLCFLSTSTCESDVCQTDNTDGFCTQNQKVDNSKYKQTKYLLYDVNPGEGFNLRRDVYIRIATLVKKLNSDSKTSKWILVLPPWGPLYHWKTQSIGFQGSIKWSKFFDISSLQKYVPVIELEDFINEYGYKIDVLYYLQHYEEGWSDDKWEEKADIRKCIEAPPYKKTKESKITGWFWGYENIFARDIFCLSIQGYSSTLKRFLESSNLSVIMIDRAEVILHDSFGDAEYWMVRRSMTFAKKLIDIGDEFRKFYLNSTDEKDKTRKLPNDLTSFIDRKAIGGPYIAVHMRRRDFVNARPKDVPSIPFAAKQIIKKMEKLNIHKLFVATDAVESEFKELQHYIPGAIRYQPTKDLLKDILDGGVAIIDQWICAHSRFFMGTYESTFSFRIQEEREILGFPVEMTFNRLCGDNQTTCTQPSKWTITFDWRNNLWYSFDFY